MSNSPLNHKRGRGIAGAAAGLFGGRKRKRNSNPNDPNTLNKLQNLSRKGGMFGAMGRLALQQQGAGGVVDNANEMQQEALGSVENTGVVNPIDIQKEQVAQASGLSALTQGPTGTPGSITAPPVESGTLADRDYNTLMGGLNQGSAFAMKSPLKQGSYEDPEQVDPVVDTSGAEAVEQIGQITSNVVAASEKKKKEKK
tara:strand:+ start:122 stop:718 length:597 start_codon:yes stop_codon:yes gene_type:complete